MRWFKFLPISALVLLAGIVGIMQLRDQAGIQSGYLMAGACLILAGMLAAQALVENGKTDDGGNMGEVRDALKDQSKAIAELAKAIKDEAAKITTAVQTRSATQANAIADAINERTDQIVKITEKVTSDEAGQDLPPGWTNDRPDNSLPTGPTGGRIDNTLPPTAETKPVPPRPLRPGQSLPDTAPTGTPQE